MRLHPLCSSAFFAVLARAFSTSEAEYSSADILTRDVCIIGGGASGTYAAIRLYQENKTVALIEKEDVLGGHVNTFYDPASNTTFDYGVISFDNISVVRDYFSYFDISLAPISYQTGVQLYANFKDGKVVTVPSTVPWTNSTAVESALEGYGVQLENYPYLVNGYNLPTPVPEDFLLSWGDFLKKYHLEALAFTALSYIQGVGNILAQPTLYIMKYFALVTLENILGTGPGFVTTADQDNHQLYDKALAKLGSDAFTSSNVTSIQRDSNETVKVAVLTPSGPKLIKASKLLIAIQPKLDNLKALGLDLNAQDTTLFGKFNNSYYWDMVIKNTGLPDNTSINNVDLAAPLALPAFPGLYGVDSTGLPGLFTAYYTSPYYVSDDYVKNDTLATLARIVAANNYTASGTPEFVGFNNHAPFELTVSTEDIADGFYDDLNALQGARNTFWTGATWQAHDSSQIWNWTEYTLLPKILASL